MLSQRLFCGVTHKNHLVLTQNTLFSHIASYSLTREKSHLFKTRLSSLSRHSLVITQ